jgi:hypothetical protein
VFTDFQRLGVERVEPWIQGPTVPLCTFALIALLSGVMQAAPSGCCSKLAQVQKDPVEIINSAAEIGAKLIDAIRSYSYYAELTIETVSAADVITGKYYRFSQVSFDTTGRRQERVLENTSTLPGDVYIATSAADNLTRVYQFFVTPEAMQEYEFNYIGREHIDELNTYVFDVRPKIRLPDPEKSPDRYLKGRIWIDDQDLCVVKVAGQAVPEQGSHRTPRFETYYQNQERYWFPTFSTADDSIRVGRSSTRVVVKVRFTGYKKTGAK